MPKPIFIVKFPLKLAGDDFFMAKKSMVDRMEDYHVLFVPIENTEFQFECFNSNEASDIDFKLLQERVLKVAGLCSNQTETDLKSTEVFTKHG